MARKGKPTGIVKVTVNMPEVAVEFIRDYAEEHGMTFTETLRRFISYQKALLDEVEAGGKILIEKPDKSFMEVFFV